MYLLMQYKHLNKLQLLMQLYINLSMYVYECNKSNDMFQKTKGRIII